MIKSLDKQKIKALNKEKIKTDTKCLRRQFRHHTGTACQISASSTIGIRKRELLN